MNKLFIGLLIVAAGAGAYFFLFKKKDKPVIGNELKKEWIVGTWKTDATPGNDSLFKQSLFNFQEDGNIIRSVGDSAKADTMHYEWNKSNELVWKQKVTDSVGTNYTVVKLTVDSLQVQSSDSTRILFTKVTK